jgi:hypothetical protein
MTSILFYQSNYKNENIVSMMMIFFLAFVYSLESPTRSEASIDEIFEKRMLDFDRTYANNTEMKKRRDIFKKGLEFIDKFNSEGICSPVFNFTFMNSIIDDC